MWCFKRFDQLTSEELFIILKERVRVFVVEQHCAYQEIDEDDLTAIHVFSLKDKELMAYCRLIPQENQVKLGRVLVPLLFRQKGLGKKLVLKAIDFWQQHYKVPLFAQAQAYLKEFYQEFGFETISEVYLEDDIPHIDMILTKNSKG
ncbi:GNAT family N-acetyltransferase [Streptococcus sp. CSL10205-OR2]|uniref:GNAT family N-acetyltransferase n=1 Tax=Streptococcus sp. CSL10205-OR2 TaxID=2980558 RepID=UPI0021D8E768|nr:GNAT family N-acetyltransferase [Streptococcus sp. CSL10205-OR2]MCU9534264.1 GNAT family N-acetyltransferase [Streptococcus sp. CSL10205-OR2]